jgi:hypothetical protein
MVKGAAAKRGWTDTPINAHIDMKNRMELPLEQECNILVGQYARVCGKCATKECIAEIPWM